MSRRVVPVKTALWPMAAVGFALVVGLLVFAEMRRDAATDRLEIVGGGFVYNYRLGEIRCSVVVRIARPVPIGSRVRAAFEDPTGGEPIIVTQLPGTDTNRIGLESPPLSGVQRDRTYFVTVLLLARDSDTVLESHRQAFRTSVDPGILPDKPLTIGPGYQRNPEISR